MKLGIKIKVLRTNSGLKREELASKIGISRETIGRIERNDWKGHLDIIYKLAEYFNIDFEILKDDNKDLQFMIIEKLDAQSIEISENKKSNSPYIISKEKREEGKLDITNTSHKFKRLSDTIFLMENREIFELPETMIKKYLVIKDLIKIENESIIDDILKYIKYVISDEETG